MDYYKEIKNELVNNEVYKKVKDYSKNRNDLQTYYQVGKLLVEAQGGSERAKYGDNLIKEYSKKLMVEVDKKYSTRNLYLMRLFYLKFHDNEILHTMCTKLSWSHYRELLGFEDNKLLFYIKISQEQNLSVRELKNRIKNKEYERLSENTKNKIKEQAKNKVQDFIKNPILIKNNSDIKNISEKVLKQLILENLEQFLIELGNGFSFIKSEYKIKMGDRYNYIDLLLYNIKFNCYVIIELKVTELKKEHIGQIETYMNYIDKNLKTCNQDRTIGIILCKKNNKFIMEYCSDNRIFAHEYNLY